MKLPIVLFLAGLACAGAATAADDDVKIGESIHLGGRVEITQAVQGPLHVAAGRVLVAAPVNGSLRMAAGRIELTPDAAVSGDASLAGGRVTVDGAVNGTLRAVGGHVTLNGVVGGDADVAGGTLDLGPQARIAGKLTFRGGELNQDPAAQVTGGVTHETRNRHWGHHEYTPGERFMRGWLWTAGLVVLAALIAAALPGPSARMALELRERPWLTPLLGLVALSTIPVAAVLLMITVIGIPIGLLAIVAYAALLLVGYVSLAVVVGGLLLDRINPEAAARTAWRMGAAVLAMITLGLLARTPIVGGLVVFAALLVGVGMVVGAVMRRTSRPAATQPA